MHVLFLSDTYRPYVSGVVTSMDSYARRLRALGHQVTIVAPEYPDTQAEPDVVRLPSVALPGYPRLRLITPVPRTLMDRLASLGPDVIHTHSPFAVGTLGLDLARIVGCPTAFTCHSYYEEYTRYLAPLSQPLRVVVRKYLVNYCGYCDLILAPSGHVRDFLREIGVETLIEVQPTGVELRREDPPPASLEAEGEAGRAAEGPKAFVIAMVGRLAKEKNLDLAIRTMAELANHSRRHRDGWRLLVIGGGPVEHRLRRLSIELGVRSLVSFAGEVSHAEVFRILRMVDAMLFTSTVETQGLVMLEAMSMGLPVVAADSPASRELVTSGVHGFVVPSDAARMAAAIELLADNCPAAQRMGQAARQRAAEYDLDSLAVRLSGLYQTLRQETAAPAARTRKPSWLDELSRHFRIEV